MSVCPQFQLSLKFISHCTRPNKNPLLIKVIYNFSSELLLHSQKVFVGFRQNTYPPNRGDPGLMSGLWRTHSLSMSALLKSSQFFLLQRSSVSTKISLKKTLEEEGLLYRVPFHLLKYKFKNHLLILSYGNFTE